VNAERPRAPERIELGGGAFLRALTPDDAPMVFATVDRERARLRPWLPWVDRSLGPADTRGFLEATAATDGREYIFGIWAADGFAGAMGLHTDPGHRSAEIGYWIDAAHEGQGLVTRSARALVTVAFGGLGMHRVWITADPRNRRSCAVAERLGFVLEGVRREDTLTDGRFRDTALYAILDREWRPEER
jgi:RimJ/RimL family protein N-acetyltransferase